MDFGGGLDGGVVVACSVDNTNNTASTATANTLFSDAVSDVETKQKWYGSVEFLKQESHFGANNTAEDYLRFSKVAKTTTTTMLRSPFVGSEGHQMLSFSTPYYQHPSFTGYGSGNMHGELCAVKGPFTPSQWMELEHQALIYKYITANIPIPHHLLNPIRKAAFSTFGLSHNSLGWNGFHLGFSNNTDPEPGRCRRTDGKKWRCSRDAVAEQKYCERHMNRGRHRSRKPVEGPSSTSTTTTTTTPKLQPPRSYGISKDGSEQENKSQHPLRQFINDWPKNQSDRPLLSWPEIDFQSDQVKLSREIEATQMRLGVGTVINEENQRETNWIPISWEPSMGGPLGEVFHGTNGRTTRCNIGSPKPKSSPTGVLQKGALF